MHSKNFKIEPQICRERFLLAEKFLNHFGQSTWHWESRQFPAWCKRHMNAYVRKHDRCCDLAKGTNYSRSSRAGRLKVAKYGKSQEERLACSRFFTVSCFPGIKTNHCRVKVNLSITVQIVASGINVGHISELQCKVWGVLVHHILETCQEECGKKWLCCISMFISCQRSAKYAGNVWNKN